MKVTPNYRNLELNGPTVRAVNQSEVEERLTNPNFEENVRAHFSNSSSVLYQFAPEAPDFGFVKEGGMYHFPVKLQHMGRDVVRFRIVQPEEVEEDGVDVYDRGEQQTKLRVRGPSERVMKTRSVATSIIVTLGSPTRSEARSIIVVEELCGGASLLVSLLVRSRCYRSRS